MRLKKLNAQTSINPDSPIWVITLNVDSIDSIRSYPRGTEGTYIIQTRCGTSWKTITDEFKTIFELREYLNDVSWDSSHTKRRQERRTTNRWIT